MRRRPGIRSAQRGVALIVMMTIIALGASWMMVSALNAASNRTAPHRNDNARVLADAKAALIGWIASTALEASENNPGRLPCPQAWGDVGTVNEGRAAGICAQPAVGWLPWRTLGLPVMRDAAGEQLWYAISPGWHLPNGSTTLTINSNTAGQLSLNGQAVVALIIAPGAPLNVAPSAAQIAAGCTARTQSRVVDLPTTPLDVLDYLECDNGSSGDFSYTATVINNATNAVLNDQVVAVTAADILPALEAAITKRIERDIVPQLQAVYAGPSWGLAAGSRLYPFAAPFTNPGPGAGTSNYQGASGTYQGLLPFNQVIGCNPATDPRCATSFISWASTPWGYDGGGWGYIQAQSCYWESADVRTCDGEYHENDTYPWQPGMIIAMQATFANVAMGLRALDGTKVQVWARDNSPDPWLVQATNASATLNADGSSTVTVSAQLPNIDTMGWGTWAQYRIRLERQIVGDHTLLDPTNATTGWFVRNEWYRLLYYATAQSQTVVSLPGTPACTTGSNCLRMRYWPGSTIEWDKRALLVVAGQSLSGTTRPNATLSDFVEFQNGDGGTLYEQLPVSTLTIANRSPSNDRVVILDTN